MLDANLKITKGESKVYKPLPKDVYQCELFAITSKEGPTYETRLMSPDMQEMETKLSFQFVLLEGKEGEEELRGRSVWANYVPTELFISKKSGKNKLYRIVEAALGRDLTDEETVNMDGNFLNGLVGKQLRVSVEPVVKGDKTYTNPKDFLKANSDLPALTEEEKEKAVVKKKDSAEEIKVEDIKF